MYITYSEYSEAGGTLTEPAFNATLPGAEAALDYATFNRLRDDTTVSDKVKNCLIKLISLIYSYNEYSNKVKDMTNVIATSQSNDGVSVSYGGYLGHTSPNDMTTISDQLDKDINKTIHTYLYGETNEAGKVLLYRGVYE